PPAPQPSDYEADPSFALMDTASRPLRATIDPPSALARTRPPTSRQGPAQQPPALDELPAADPFAGFAAPPPSLLQRWLIVVVALAVVGLCSLVAIAFGLLGKTGW